MKAMIVGNLGKDAELRNTANTNTLVLSFSVAESVYVSGEQKTQWVNVSMFGDRGKNLAQYLTKGTKVAVFGEVHVNEWTDRNTGITRWGLNCRAFDITLCGSKKDADAAAPAAASSQPTSEEVKFDDDDIPF